MTEHGFQGFKSAVDAAESELQRDINDIEDPTKRRRLDNLLDNQGVDKSVINALSAEFVDDRDDIRWLSQHAIHQFRRGEDDLISVLEEGQDMIPQGSVQGHNPTHIGIEYEINVPGIFDFSDDDEHVLSSQQPYFVRNFGDLLVEQETGPRTLEIISDVYPGIEQAVDAVMKREKFVEGYLQNHDVPGASHKSLRRHSGEHNSYFPGVHIHLDPDQNSDLDTTQSALLDYVPELSFLTANAEGDVNGTEYLSERQVKTIGGGYPNGNVIMTDRGTIEIRVPDVQAEKDDWIATTAASVGIAKYAEAQGYGPNHGTDNISEQLERYFQDITTDDQIGSIDFEEFEEEITEAPGKYNIDCRIKSNLSEGPARERMDEFMRAVGIGLELAGYETEEYMPMIQDKIDSQYGKVDNLN